MSIAHELITRGWAQGQAEDEQGRVCITRAARYALGVDQLPVRVLRVLCAACGEWAPNFNDAPGRTFDEVLRVAKEADEILDGAA